jgi:pyrroline-5-carboxylate reductase
MTHTKCHAAAPIYYLHIPVYYSGMQLGTLAILGVGNLGHAIVDGLQRSGLIQKQDFILTEKNPQRREQLKNLGYAISDDNAAAVRKADLVLIVVKPWQIEAILQEIAPVVDPARHVLASTVTGVDSGRIYAALGKTPPLFRVMPNTGIAIRESITCISSTNATRDQERLITELFNQLGRTLIIPEDLMSAATVMGGCGIAFALRFIRAAIQGGIEIGFNADDAKVLAAMIAKGAAELILQNGTHPEQEIDKVTTPKGITITGLNEMEHTGFSSAIIKGIMASYKKIDE